MGSLFFYVISVLKKILEIFNYADISVDVS